MVQKKKKKKMGRPKKDCGLQIRHKGQIKMGKANSITFFFLLLFFLLLNCSASISNVRIFFLHVYKFV